VDFRRAGGTKGLMFPDSFRHYGFNGANRLSAVVLRSPPFRGTDLPPCRSRRARLPASSATFVPPCITGC